MSSIVTELVLFKLKPGIDQEAVQAAATQMMPWLRQQPGFLRRELSASDTGQWVDIVHWTDLGSAQQAATVVMSAPEAHTFMTLLDEEQITMVHLHQVLEETTHA